jgi:FOG: GGDEF domain
MVGSQTDITGRKQRRAAGVWRASRCADGVAESNPLYGPLSLALKRAQREKHLFAVLFLDLDRFKTINDSWGMLRVMSC